MEQARTVPVKKRPAASVGFLLGLLMTAPSCVLFSGLVKEHWRAQVRLVIERDGEPREIEVEAAEYWETGSTDQGRPRAAVQPESLAKPTKTLRLPWIAKEVVAHGDILYLRVWPPKGVRIKVTVFLNNWPHVSRFFDSESTEGRPGDLRVEF